MNLRPLVGNFADPQYKLSRADQKRLTLKAHKEHLSQRTLWLIVLAMVIVSLLGFAFVHPLLTALLGSWGVIGNAFPNLPWAWLIAFILYTGAVWLASSWAFRFLYIRPIRMAMRDEGYNLCLACGYDLRGQPESTPDHVKCPECSTTRVPMPSSSTTSS